jgi:GTP pyrophosphokinase
LKSKFGNNIIAARWDVHETLFNAQIAIKGIDEEGILLKIADILYSQHHTNVTALNIEGKNGVFEAKLGVMVHNVNEVTAICQSLKKIKLIVKVYRLD